MTDYQEKIQPFKYEVSFSLQDLASPGNSNLLGVDITFSAEDREFNCPICFDQFGDKTVKETNCGHFYCPKCIGTVTNKACPECCQTITMVNEPPKFFRNKLAEYKARRDASRSRRANPVIDEEVLNTAPVPADGSRFQVIVSDLNELVDFLWDNTINLNISQTS